MNDKIELIKRYFKMKMFLLYWSDEKEDQFGQIYHGVVTLYTPKISGQKIFQYNTRDIFESYDTKYPKFKTL